MIEKRKIRQWRRNGHRGNQFFAPARFRDLGAFTSYFVYYLPPTSDQMADLRFNADRVRDGIAKIKAMVSKRHSGPRLADP